VRLSCCGCSCSYSLAAVILLVLVFLLSCLAAFSIAWSNYNTGDLEQVSKNNRSKISSDKKNKKKNAVGN